MEKNKGILAVKKSGNHDCSKKEVFSFILLSIFRNSVAEYVRGKDIQI